MVSVREHFCERCKTAHTDATKLTFFIKGHLYVIAGAPDGLQSFRNCSPLFVFFVDISTGPRGSLYQPPIDCTDESPRTNRPESVSHQNSKCKLSSPSIQRKLDEIFHESSIILENKILTTKHKASHRLRREEFGRKKGSGSDTRR